MRKEGKEMYTLREHDQESESGIPVHLCCYQGKNVRLLASFSQGSPRALLSIWHCTLEPKEHTEDE